MAEWSKALVLGTSHFDGVGSNPTTANFFHTQTIPPFFFFHGPTKYVFVEGSCEVHTEELAMVDGQSHHPPSESEVAEVVGINVRVAVGLKRRSYTTQK